MLFIAETILFLAFGKWTWCVASGTWCVCTTNVENEL